MDQPQQDANADTRSRTGSETRLLVPQSAGASNSRALKIAGLTTLVCALLASQIFTAVMVFDQNKQIDNLQRKSEQMGRDLSRAPKGVPPARMQVPLRSLPMVMDIPIDSETKKPQSAPKAPPQPPAPEPVVSMEEQVKGFIQDFDLPSFNKTFMANLEGLKKNIQEEEWKSFESWMRYWLIFKMAQDKPEMTKCQEEKQHDSGKLGSFKPQCDEQGGYKPRQCWHATGFCWCVDKTGKAIEGTSTRGWPQCA